MSKRSLSRDTEDDPPAPRRSGRLAAKRNTIALRDSSSEEEDLVQLSEAKPKVAKASAVPKPKPAPKLKTPPKPAPKPKPAPAPVPAVAMRPEYNSNLGSFAPRYTPISLLSIPTSIAILPSNQYHNGLPPTISQFLRHLTSFSITTNNISNFRPPLGEIHDTCNDQYTCSICLCPYEIGETLLLSPCLHKYHFDCVLEWFESQQDKKQEREIEPLTGELLNYRANIQEFNEQFMPRQIFERFATVIDGEMVYQIRSTYRSPNITEINNFRPPPAPPPMEWHKRICIDILCPTCRCDWKQAFLAEDQFSVD